MKKRLQFAAAVVFVFGMVFVNVNAAPVEIAPDTTWVNHVPSMVRATVEETSLFVEKCDGNFPIERCVYVSLGGSVITSPDIPHQFLGPMSQGLNVYDVTQDMSTMPPTLLNLYVGSGSVDITEVMSFTTLINGKDPHTRSRDQILGKAKMIETSTMEAKINFDIDKIPMIFWGCGSGKSCDIISQNPFGGESLVDLEFHGTMDSPTIQTGTSLVGGNTHEHQVLLDVKGMTVDAKVDGRLLDTVVDGNGYMWYHLSRVKYPSESLTPPTSMPYPCITPVACFGGPGVGKGVATPVGTTVTNSATNAGSWPTTESVLRALQEFRAKN